ncbi:myosin phosphatase Rho-interacting protein isoform X3 [Electrophorus electricus]|uniref:myosin phosphatase Rho-interacting protein isoform X3 n=1 Tax=Electrophorus electricus TaxID=8005 RepID=UPI0015D07BAD|nr:myosin phosphatase Rho-interacting protein isoform X3 [Electrophorus electricus]
MSTAKENPCRKFQANIFNKSKCQNCFKPRELHLLTDQDLNQAKPIYGGWLCLAPEGTDFDNPMQRSRKWQRRFFVLYEHGCLRFALDESPSTLPQGTVNMNLCTDVIDAEPKTGQKNALCIVTPEQEYYIRGDNKEIINGWSEQLVVYPRTNKQNQKKKRKVEPTATQEPGPAKVAVTGSGIPEAEKVPDSSSIIWQEELHSREAEASQVWSSTDMAPQSSVLPSAAEDVLVGRGSNQGSVNGDEVDRSGFSFPQLGAQPPRDLLSPTGSTSSRHSAEAGGVPRCLSPAPSDPFPSGSSLLSNGSHISGSMSSLDSDASGSTVASTESHAPRLRRPEGEARKTEKRSRLCSPDRRDRETLFSPERSGRSNVIEKLEALELEQPERMEVEEARRGEARQGRSETRRSHRQEQRSDPAQDLDFCPSTLPPLRRAKSLDRRTTESVMTPDLLNFKKGWMVKLDEHEQWKKYWFVLTDHSLRYYKDSIAEEASDLDGEIDLTTCYSVTEYQAQRNYGFQIHTQEGIHTLSAMTAGIRRNWIQAVMKNVRPSTAPDVASLTDDHGSCIAFESLVRPDVTQDSPSSDASSMEQEPKRSRARERRREGRSKTFDWAEFRPIAQALAQQRAHEADALQALPADAERSRRREERRRRYESVTGGTAVVDPVVTTDAGVMDVENTSPGPCSACPLSPERQQKVEDEIEQRWQQVEKTPIREERRVPLSTALRSRETTELEKLLESYKKGVCFHVPQTDLRGENQESVEELKMQLEMCHLQLADSDQQRRALEGQLKVALEREHQVRAGYISPLESPLSLETKLLMKKPELVSSQAQSLTKKYQETKELLQLQELRKRNMQAQLGLSLSCLSTKEPYFPDTKSATSHEILPSDSITKPLTLLLLDNEGKIKELEDLLDCSRPLSVKELMKLLHSLRDSESSDFLQEKNEHDGTDDITKCQKLLENLKNQQDIENETVRNSLAKAGDSIRDYEARLITMEDMLGRVQRQKAENLKTPCVSPCQRDDPTQITNCGLSQKVELLTSENDALTQRYQEIVNQLREADREIDRLKAELQRLQNGQQHQLARVGQDIPKQEDKEVNEHFYEQQLNEKSQKLQEALLKLEMLGNSLKETEKRLQLKEATLKGLGFQLPEDDKDESLLEKEKLRHHIEVIESKLSEKERLLHSADKFCQELQAQNKELQVKNQECEKTFNQLLLEAREEIRMLHERDAVEVESNNRSGVDRECQGSLQSCGGTTEEVLEGFRRRTDALNLVLEVLIKANEKNNMCESFSIGIEKDSSARIWTGVTKVLFEQEILSRVLGGIENCEGDCAQPFAAVKDVVGCMLMENKILFSMMNLSAEQDTETSVNTENTETASLLVDQTKVADNHIIAVIMKELTEEVQNKVTLLNQIASLVNEPANELLQSLASAHSNCVSDKGLWSQYVHDAILDVSCTYFIMRQRIQQEKELQAEVQSDLHATKDACSYCPQLRKQNMEQKAKLKQMQIQLSSLQNPISEDSKPVTHMQIEGEPIDSLDKAIQIQDMVAKHKKELRELRELYDQEAGKLRQEVAKAGETLRLRSEENIKEIDSLTHCMENLRKKHEMEQNLLVDHFNQEMEELSVALGLQRADLPDDGQPSPASLKQRIHNLVSQVSDMTEETRCRDEDAALLRLKYEKDLENLKATCERGFAAMEESHQKVVDELQRKHQRELEKLQEEKERLLEEETAATIAAIEAMKNAHRIELEKELDRARKANSNAENADIEEIRRQHEEELVSFQREIEVLSEQYSQKCLENAHLAQALEAERQALRQCQRENQELNAHNQELNNRLAAEITKMRSMTSEEGGESGTVIHGKERYELEVMLRVKESEVQYLKQEINSLKDELQAAQRDKKYATDKYKDMYTELSIVKAKAERDLGRLREQLQMAHEALGEPTPEDVQRRGYDIMKSKSNPDILKMAAAAAKRSERTMRSKSLKEGLTPEQRLHLFDNKDAKEF